MKELLEFEKKIIEQIIISHKLNQNDSTIHILAKTLLRHPINFHIDETTKNITIGIDIDYQTQLLMSHNPDKLSYDINSFFSIVIKLIQYLGIENLITYENINQNDKIIGAKFKNEGIQTLNSREIENLLYYLIGKKIIPQNSLIELAKNNFQSKEKLQEISMQKSFKRRLNWTAIGVIISLLFGFTSNLIELYKIRKQNNNEFRVIIDNTINHKTQQLFLDTSKVDTIKLLKE